MNTRESDIQPNLLLMKKKKKKSSPIITIIIISNHENLGNIHGFRGTQNVGRSLKAHSF